MANPLEQLKAMWRDPKKRPWMLAGAGATGAAAIYTLRKPTSAEDKLAEDNAAEGVPASFSATPIDASLDPNAAGAGGGYYALPVIPSSGLIGGDGGGSGMDEMDFSPFWDALDEQAELGQETVAAAVASSQVQTAEQIAQVKAAGKATAAKQQKQIKRVRTKNQRQQKQIKRVKTKNKKQQQAIRRLRQRAKRGPKRKPKASSRGR